MSDRAPVISSSVVKGSLWMLAAGLLFSAMAVLVKLGACDSAAVELVFYRSVYCGIADLSTPA